MRSRGGAARQARTLVGLAGSVTTVAAIALGCPPTTRGVHHTRICRPTVRAVRRPARHDPRRARRAAVMHPGRVDVIGAGALVLVPGRRRCSARPDVVVASEHDILDGIAWSLATGQAEAHTSAMSYGDRRPSAGTAGGAGIEGRRDG